MVLLREPVPVLVKVVPSKVKFASPFNPEPLVAVTTRLSEPFVNPVTARVAQVTALPEPPLVNT